MKELVLMSTLPLFSTRAIHLGIVQEDKGQEQP